MNLQLSPAGRSYGRRRDIPDKRDKVLSVGRPLPLPPSHFETEWLGSVRDQLQEGSCVGHGWAGHREWLARKFQGIFPDLSPQFVYYLCRQQEGTLPSDAGSTVRTGARVINKFGTCPESGDPYGPETMNTPPTALATGTALSYKGGAYHRLLDMATMRSCLASGYCFVDGIEVYESFESDAVATSGEVPMPQAGEPMLGGHCTLTTGYDDGHKNLDGSVGAFLKRNSWGSGWGQAGNFWLPYSYFPYMSDAWVMHLGPAWV